MICNVRRDREEDNRKSDGIIRDDSVAGQAGATSEDDEEEIIGEEGRVVQWKEMPHQPTKEKYDDHMKPYIALPSGNGVTSTSKWRGIMIHMGVLTTRMSGSCRRCRGTRRSRDQRKE